MAKRTRTGDPKLAIALVRSSTEDQKLGPEAQRAAIEAWAAREGVTVAAWHVEHVSGGADIAERPGLVAALGDVRVLGAGLFVVLRRDRLARDPYIALAIERAAASSGARVVTADGTANGDTPADAFMRAILDAAAAYEKAMIVARTRAALAAKAAKGERIGAVPYGFAVAADGRTLTRDDVEHAVLVCARELRTAGLSIRAIVAELSKRGLVSRTGQAFGTKQVHRMVTR
jgi:DNA invertase Pin-like site-specific DNA recombinase